MCSSPSLSRAIYAPISAAQREDQGDGIEEGPVEAGKSIQVAWLLEDPAQLVIRGFPAVVNETLPLKSGRCPTQDGVALIRVRGLR